MNRVPGLLFITIMLSAAAARVDARPSYDWRLLSFRGVPYVTFERSGDFLVGVFPRQSDSVGERMEVHEHFMGPEVGQALLVLHSYHDKDLVHSRLHVIRLTEPVPKLVGTVELEGAAVDLADLDGDAVPELIYPVDLQEPLSDQAFTISEVPSVDLVLRWDVMRGRFAYANEAFPLFLGGRLGAAYEDLRSHKTSHVRRGMIAIAHYFSSTGQADSAAKLLGRHLPDARQQRALKRAFAEIRRVEWLPACACARGWTCHPKARLCQPRDTATAWKGWPRRIELTVKSARVYAAASKAKFWDDDGSDPDPFIELHVDGEEPRKSPIAQNTVKPRWGWSQEFTLYPPSVLKLMVKEDDPSFDQLIAMKTLRAGELVAALTAIEAGVMTMALNRVPELVLLVEEIEPEP